MLIHILRNLSYNALSGQLPDAFGALPSLTTLCVLQAPLRICTDRHCCTDRLLDSNELTGSLPPSLSTSTALSTLHLANNTFSGSVSFPNALNLTDLYIARNTFTTIDLRGNAKLEKVALDDNQFSGALPDLSHVPSLVSFTAARNQFSGPAFDLTALQGLNKLCVGLYISWLLLIVLTGIYNAIN